MEREADLQSFYSFYLHIKIEPILDIGYIVDHEPILSTLCRGERIGKVFNYEHKV